MKAEEVIRVCCAILTLFIERGLPQNIEEKQSNVVVF
jgi:hypothetical protein